MRAISAAAMLLALSACTPNVSPDSYAVGTAGQVNRVVRGKVINARQVDLSGTQSGVGAGAGALAGGVGGSYIGGGTRSNIVGAIGGAVAGGIAGAVAEEAATRQKGVEYIVETENGSLITIVQGADAPLSVGDRVLVLYGTRSRIIPDTSAR